jgi:LysM repeat protein
MRKGIVALLVILGILSLIVRPAEARPAGWSTICSHVVQPGETLYCIARAYGVSPMAIATYNGLLHPNFIYPGQVLAIPDAFATIVSGPTCVAQCPAEPPAPACTCAAYHTITTGETLFGIALHYGVSMWRIAECNDILNLNYIRIGDVLCIPSS